MVASMFSLVACGPSEEEQAAAEAEAAAAVEELFNGLEEEIDAATEEVVAEVELADHVCSDNCTEEACSFACGEKGHKCGDACHAEEGEEHGHDHAEGEEHDHS